MLSAMKSRWAVALLLMLTIMVGENRLIHVASDAYLVENTPRLLIERTVCHVFLLTS